ncbi:RagB/SusD family nutrient uptake outer membrane protein [Flavitalea sp. BT771]|uniref:RagB/SusD family nutrient uptake outer membrane protein n=1 Tax=Flavitalea sp. BT771 TaxID=3063329 RepID=UPI0026E3315D|nr:RagB/SusD family nutrient uptake outer membrane protein [Flavitalea sp. BT771]MDO6431776.1 RagB/SusD family nutrient uptake outer membrane protein [Flavitalea sp. BT771]MDV6220684.1 RagB/SusD family nutrient uptake outer membrane protein [Flavitalea sp. BT771]
MKNIKFKLFCLFILLSGMFSCKKDFLDTKSQTTVPSSSTWTDGPLSTAFVTGIYSGLGMGGFDEQMLASLSDEAVFTHAGRGINTINEGTLNPSNLGWTNNTYEWTNMYNHIRTCNVALEQLPVATFSDAALKKQLMGEAHFLRGYFYHQLLRYYGGVPLISKTYGLNEDYTIARNTFEECVNFISKECDSAVLLLTGMSMPSGRASVNAALALKSRLLLYAASDLHDMTKAKANSATIGAYAHPELLGYTTSDPATRWTAAMNAAKAVLDDAGSGYKLGLSAPETSAAAQANYLSIAMGGGSKAPGIDATAASELLFTRDFTPNKDEYAGIYVGLANGPNGYHNWAGNSPIQELVDDYEMMDGSRFDWNNATQKAAPYVNRDPRFYATILYDGAGWKPRDKISGNVDPVNQIQVGSYQVASGMIPGLDTRQSSIENWNGSWTGYYMKKFIDPDPNIVDNTTRQYIPWPFFRYTEAVLNYVEANIELGNEPEARNWLNKIRYRAGMPAIPVTVTGDSLRQRYRNERRIEMAYEEQRYHDARRWMIAPATLGRKLVYMSVTGMLKSGATAPSPYRHDETLYNYTYSPVVDNSLENRQWVDKMYFRPISRDEMIKNNKLVQNPGYE